MLFPKFSELPWKKQSSTTLQRRLILFISLAFISIILLFMLLLNLFGVTGSGVQTVRNYLTGELVHIADTLEDDFADLAITGVNLARNISAKAEESMQPGELLDACMPNLLSVAEYNTCGGVFLILDGEAGRGHPGIFIKKTQPVSSPSLPSKVYCLRGPANIARDHDIELLGQWKMLFEASELDFFHDLLETYRENAHLPLSRLYCWTNRVCLNDNSEAGILLCVPLRLSDGEIIGICGIEVSDRMFKQLYSPNESSYHGGFSLLAPADDAMLHAEKGLLAGNSYLTGRQLSAPLTAGKAYVGFSHYENDMDSYGGLARRIRLYPDGSPFEAEWELAVLIPDALLTGAIRGSTDYLYFIVAALLLASLIGSVLISRHYLHPIKRGISSIQNREFERESAAFGVQEIDSLFEGLAQNAQEHRSEVERLEKEKQDAQSEHEKAQSEIARLAYHRKQEIDPDDYQAFREGIATLTPTERAIFDHYVEGKEPKEIMEILGIKENTLKYHNKHIFGKLGVANRKELLRYVSLMK